MLSESSGRPSSFNSQFSRCLVSRSRSLDGVARTWLLALRFQADINHMVSARFGCSFGRAPPHRRKSRDSIFHPCSLACHVLCLTGTAAAQPVLEIVSFWLASKLAFDGSIVHCVACRSVPTALRQCAKLVTVASFRRFIPHRSAGFDFVSGSNMCHVLGMCISNGISFNCCESVRKHHNSAHQNFAKRANALIIRRVVRLSYVLILQHFLPE